MINKFHILTIHVPIHTSFRHFCLILTSLSDLWHKAVFVPKSFDKVIAISLLFQLQRLAQDPNYAVARAASRAIDELKKQWELEEGDSLRFVMNQNLASRDTEDDNSPADDAA
jgi:hypothetical protein